MIDAENAGDDAGLLTVLNETMGFYRSQGRHKENQWIVQRALELATRMGITGTEAWTTTLINAATAMRAAGQYDQSEDLYKQAQASSERTLAPSDRRLAALHNNLSMLYSETGKTHQPRWSWARPCAYWNRRARMPKPTSTWPRRTRIWR